MLSFEKESGLIREAPNLVLYWLGYNRLLHIISPDNKGRSVIEMM